MRLIAVVSVCVGLVPLALTACGTDAADDDPGPQPVARATWYQDVAPILSKHCMSCHQDGGIAPFSLTDVESARSNATRAIDKIDQGVMPPFDAREEASCTPRFNFVDDPRLTSDEKRKLRDWVADGYALGVEQPIARPPNTDLQGVTQTLQPVMPFATQGNRDQFICFILDPAATQLTWMTGMQVRPGNELVVHHVVLTEVVAGTTQNQLVAAHGIGKPYECTQMAEGNQFVISIWTPGNQPMQTPSELAVPIFKDAKIVMQIHYHPAGAINDPDITAVDLRTSSIVPRRMYSFRAFGNERQAPNLLPDPDDVGAPQFVVPKNTGDHVEHMRITVPSLPYTDPRIYSANPHMHLVGTHIAGRIERPAARGNDPQTECLANGGWNFDWQRTYIYDTPLDRLPSIQPGDIIDVTCRWNNTISNPFVQRMLNDSHLPPQPIDIKLGEQTIDEMCLEIFGLSVAVTPQLAAALAAGTIPPELSTPLQLR